MISGKIFSKISFYFQIARLNKPLAILFLLLPALFNIIFVFKSETAISNEFFAKIIIFFTIGAIIMRSAGCVINDIFDRKIDAKVSRTKERPLAKGEISLFEALIFLFFLLFLGLIILLQFNLKTIILGFLALILVSLYPLMKRITFYPQIFLGVVFNFGVLMSNSALNQEFLLSKWLLYCACILWTVIYDTIYGFQDIEDDLKIGVKSSAIAFSKNPRKILSILSILMCFLLIFVGILQKTSFSYHFLIILAIFYLIYLIFRTNFKNPKQCLKAFKNNILVGFLILLAIFSA